MKILQFAGLVFGRSNVSFPAWTGDEFDGTSPSGSMPPFNCNSKCRIRLVSLIPSTAASGTMLTSLRAHKRWTASLPPLSYGLSRNIEIPWLAPATYGLSFFALVFLTVLNGTLCSYRVFAHVPKCLNALGFSRLDHLQRYSRHDR